ncbi:MAG TPA: sodium:solute symporter family protein [Rugosimonospora sp.]|nr:sodium:solute symporter family protein [Rugosimonospora sp.]
MGSAVGHETELWVFLGLLGVALILGIAASRWRQPRDIHSLEEWGVGGRAFGNWVTWFLLGGSAYTAYTFVAAPAFVYGAGALGFFAVPFSTLCAPLVYVIAPRTWSVAHRHGFVTNAEYARARFGSRGLAALVALTGIVATMPYIAVQLLCLQAVFRVMGITGDWPLVIALGLVAACTFRSGLRAPALLSIAKDILMIWVIIAALLVVAIAGGLGSAFDLAKLRYTMSATPGTGVLLGPGAEWTYLTLIIGSALSIFAYPHTLTSILAARDRATIKRNSAALPVYTLGLAIMSILGVFAIAQNVLPIGFNPATGSSGDLNTVIPQLFHTVFPQWCAGIAFAGLAIAALVPAAVMSIAAANLFTRSIYREYLRPGASPREEARVSRWVSLLVKLGAIAVILLINPRFSTDLQLIGGAIVLQILPAVCLSLWTRWLHRWAVLLGLVAGLAVAAIMLYQVPQLGPRGVVVRPHFGGTGWPLSHLGLHTQISIYAGLLALVLNLGVAVVATPVLRLLRIPDGVDTTRPADYQADGDDPTIKRLDDLLDGQTLQSAGAHSPY